MHGIAMGIAEDLAFDMAGIFHQLFQIDFILAKGGLCLALGLRDFAGQIAFGADHPHAASATAPGGLEHQRIANLARHFGHGVHVIRQRFGGGHHGNADFDRQIARGDLIAQLPHRIGGRADENQTCIVTGIDKFRTFGQKAIARMDGVRA